MNNYVTVPSGMTLFEACSGACLFIFSFASSDFKEQEKIRQCTQGKDCVNRWSKRVRVGSKSD